MSERKDRTGAGDSNIARSFGASVDVRMQSDSLSLVVGREHSPKALIQGAGGKVAIELSPTTVIAAMPLATHLSFRNHPDLRFIGPVTLDPARYAQFISVLQQRGPCPEQLECEQQRPNGLTADLAPDASTNGIPVCDSLPAPQRNPLN